ncbi:hypothetical protein G3R49_06925 [Shewanella sp. WXL01]|uniref:hypothetical protein n=1 Tax=Shewanella sp. WXL01 TaxID=2709721 RepID=UPI0014384584|nr:hypothetical protein [Shewanella sp. WXL01]NKF50305.1 hypothetical protein [Shewanella sp. WXL01]
MSYKADAESLAINYLRDLLSQNYDAMHQYIGVEQFSLQSHLTIAEFLQCRVNEGKLSSEYRQELESDLVEQGLTQEELEETTLEQLLTYYFVEMYRVNSGVFGGEILGELELISSTQTDENEIYYVFKVHQKVSDEENPELTREFSSAELVSVKLLGEVPVIIHPVKVVLCVELLAKGLLEING